MIGDTRDYNTEVKDRDMVQIEEKDSSQESWVNDPEDGIHEQDSDDNDTESVGDEMEPEESVGVKPRTWNSL